MNERLRVAVDIGGTFTDVVVFDPRTNLVTDAKSSTTPDDFARGVFDALDESSVSPGSIERLIHGTTVVINAITQRTGVRTALITTRGFRDVLHIGRGNRPDMYNLRFHKPEPLVPRRLRFEVDERVLADGTVETPLDVVRLQSIASSCRDERVEAIAICFLHSYAWPAHEQLAKSMLTELLPGVRITCSSDICREWREYERSSTAVLNAYVQPILETYLGMLDDRLDDQSVTGNRLVMLSNGGTATFAFARSQPIQLVESGPAGGIAGAIAIGRQIGEPNLITLDIGGTTAKCSVIVGGEAAISQDYRLEWTPFSTGYPLRVPVVDIVEIGAGGGSIVWFDEAGALRIGPRSAGADPGPACYGRGGTEPTVTDAMVLAGILDPAGFIGGRIAVDPSLSLRAFEPVANRLGLSISETVAGVMRLFSALTVEALKLVSVRRGHDPRDFALIAFGGGGPIHAGNLARELGVKRLVIPPFPATFSGWGMLASAPRLDLSQTRISTLADMPSANRRTIFESLEADARATFERQGYAIDSIDHIRAIDVRYQGQEHTVTVPVSVDDDDTRLVSDFHRLHEQLYTFRLDSTPIELVGFRLSSRIPLEAMPGCDATSTSDGRPQSVRFRSVPTISSIPVPIYRRAELSEGRSLFGPAIVEEASATTVILERQQFTVDVFGNIVITGVEP